MSPLVTCNALTQAFGTKTLFKAISLSLFSGERVGVVGPNGAGKSTLLKIIAGKLKPDEGEVVKKRGLRIGYVPQFSTPPEKPLIEVMLDEVPNEVEAKKWLSIVGFDDYDQIASRLSGGWQKKLDLARAMIGHPDVLLLDEPTNHLDLESIEWLEDFLMKEVPTFIVTSHDRRFLQRVTSRMYEVNPSFPKGFFTSEGSYHSFLEKKEGFLLGQSEYQKSLATKVRRESAWLRETPQARTTKSRSRIDKAHSLIQELSDVKRRGQKRKLDMDFSASERATKKLLQAKNISKMGPSALLFSQLEILLSPGTRLGILGPNGSGKSTLLKILALQVPPDTGTVKVADGLQIVYFDQMRETLPMQATIKEALSPRGDYVNFRGKEIHVSSWGKKFFFSPDLLDLPISQLSGGERARLLMARLMLKPADILLLDEPTNDLDIETLEMIEESLEDFPGAVVLITHDREMMDRIAQEKIVLTGRAKTETKKELAPAAPKKNLKISFKDKFEYESLGKKIEELEKEILTLAQALSEAKSQDQLATLGLALHEKEEALNKAFDRWHELSQLF